MRKLILCLLAALTVSGAGQDFIAADFRTSEGDFTVALDYLNAPLAVSNFIHLAGKGDDVFETPNNAPLLTSFGHYQQSFYNTIAESDTQRLSLRVQLIAATETFRAYYAVYQGSVYIGGVETTLVNTPYYPDITGQDRIRLQLVSSSPIRYRITLRYPRPWLDARDQIVKPAPMYVGLKINRVVTGKRFYAGGMTRSLLEHPGYHFQDEVLRTPGNTNNPFGTPFTDAWVLGMDTVGPNRNGSRFFITSAADPSLNGKHTAFGVVAQNIGRSVVTSIANSSVGVDGEPTTAMYIWDISIRRGGLTAYAFFEGFHQAVMPGQIEELCLGIQQSGSEFSLTRPSRPSSQFMVYTSTDLVNYSGGLIEAQSPSSLEASLTEDITQTVAFFPKLFVKGFSTRIPFWPSEEIELEEARFAFEVTSNNDEGTLSLVLGENVGDEMNEVYIGTYSIDMSIEQTNFGEDPVFVSADGSGTCTVTYDATKGPYEGVFNFTNVTGPLNVDQLSLHFDSSRFANNPQVPESAIIRRFDARVTDPEVDFLGYSGNFQKLD